VKRTITAAVAVVTVGVMAYVSGYLLAGPQDPQTSQGQIQPVNANIPQPPPAPPRTRIAVINLAQVIKSYDKWKTFEESYKQAFGHYNAEFETRKAKGLQLKGDLGKLAPDDPKADAMKVELRKLDHEVQDLGEEAKKYLNKMQDEMAIQIYHEVNEAVEHYARANDIEMVMHFNDGITAQEILNPANVQRKLQNPACMPMYVTPGMNITGSIVEMLNQRLRAMTPAQPAAPQR
jgi:Skp family chaperone for outer membrane proteins